MILETRTLYETLYKPISWDNEVNFMGKFICQLMRVTLDKNKPIGSFPAIIAPSFWNSLNPNLGTSVLLGWNLKQMNELNKWCNVWKWI